jgi:hypothetical protein
MIRRADVISVGGEFRIMGCYAVPRFRYLARPSWRSQRGSPFWLQPRRVFDERLTGENGTHQTHRSSGDDRCSTAISHGGS